MVKTAGTKDGCESPVKLLRRSIGGTAASEVSKEAMAVAREILAQLPSLSKQNRCRVALLCEHHVRDGSVSVIRDAAGRVAKEAAEGKIKDIWRYLTAACANAADEAGDCSGVDARLLADLSENTQGEGSPANEDRGGVGTESESLSPTPQLPEPDREAIPVWEEVLEDASEEINAPSLRVWFEGTVPVDLEDSVLTFSTPNSFAAEYIESRFSEILCRHLSERLGQETKIKLVSRDPASSSPPLYEWKQ